MAAGKCHAACCSRPSDETPRERGAADRPFIAVKHWRNGMLKKTVWVVSIALCLALVVPAGAAAPRTYQVTGPVLSLTDDLIVVQKGNDKWEIARDASVKVTGELKVGANVTIE